MSFNPAHRVLVAGGAGFIGSHLCQRLIDDGSEVICFDNLSTGRTANIASLLRHPAFTFIHADIVDPLPRLPKVHQIFHLASPASPPGYRERPVETLRVNSEGTRRLLEVAAHYDAHFLYTSTSEVYGDPLEHPQCEEYRGNVSSTGPRSMYDEAKRYGEALTVAFAKSRDIDVRIVRLFNTYGPNSDPDDGRMIPNFVTQAILNRPITIYGDGSQTRSLCFVSDTVEGIVRAMETPGLRAEVVNLGNPREHTVLEYAQIIKRLVGSDSELIFTEQAVGDDPQRRRPDISKARRLLAWEPLVDLEAGLERSVEYFRREVGAPVAAVVGRSE